LVNTKYKKREEKQTVKQLLNRPQFNSRSSLQICYFIAIFGYTSNV